MRWLRFIFSHSLFVSFCAAALTLHSSFLISQTTAFPLTGLVFSSTLFSYNAYWILAEWDGEWKSLKTFLYARSSGLLLMLISIVGVLFFLRLNPGIIGYLSLSGLFTVLYFLPVILKRRISWLQRFGPVKTFLLAFTWSFVTVCLPLSHIICSFPVILLFCQRFFFMLMLCIIFDARDTQMDKIRALHSLATSVSARGLSGIFFLSLFLFGIFTFLVFCNNGLFFHFYFSLFSGFCASGLFLLSRKPRGYFFYYFLVDGMMLLMASSSLFCLFFD